MYKTVLGPGPTLRETLDGEEDGEDGEDGEKEGEKEGECDRDKGDRDEALGARGSRSTRGSQGDRGSRSTRGSQWALKPAAPRQARMEPAQRYRVL